MAANGSGSGRDRGRVTPADGSGVTLSAEEGRQGRIVLTTPLRRWIFFGGLVAVILLALIVGWAA